MSRETELAKNTFIFTVGKICTQFISFFLLPLYTSFLSPDEFGIVDLFNTYVMLFLPIVNWSFDLGLFRFMLEVRGNCSKLKSLVSTVINTNIVQCVGYIVLFWFVHSFIHSEYKFFLLLNVILNVFTSTFLQMARGFGDNIGYTCASLISVILNISVNIFTIVILRMGEWGLFIGIIIAQIVTLIFLIIKEKIWRYYKFLYWKKFEFLDVFQYSLPLIPAQLSWWTVGTSDRIIISRFINLAANGTYSIANKFSTIISTFYNIFNLAWSESIAIHFNDEDKDDFLSETIEAMLMIFFTICIDLVAILPMVFPLMIHSDYNDAYFQIPILIVSVFFQVVTGLYSVIYLAIKKTKESAKTAILAAGINIFVDLLLINKIGLYAASISTLIAYMSMAIYRHIDVKKYARIRLNIKKVLISIFVGASIILIYYLNIKYLNIIGFIIASIYTILINKSILITVMEKIKIYVKK